MITLLAFTALAVATSPCDGRALPEGPVPAGFGEADFGVVPAACPRTEVGFGLDGRAIIEAANFYGNVRAAGRLDASVQPFPQLELSLSTEVLAYQVVIQSFKADHLGFGDTSAAVKLLAFAKRGFALSVYGRTDLPTAIGYYANAFPVGLEAGVLMTLEPVDDLRLHGGLLGASSFAFTKANSDQRGAVIANAGVDVVMFEWLALVADLDGQALQRGSLDHLSLGLGVRGLLFGLGIEAGAVIPFAGDERAVTTGILRVAWRFE